MMLSIRQRLLCAEDNFLSAVTKGTAAVESFNDEQWTPLLHDLDNAILSSHLDSDILSLAYATSSRIAILAESFHELQVTSQKLTADLMDELDAIASQLTLADSLTPAHSSRETSPLSASDIEHIHFPSGGTTGTFHRHTIDGFNTQISPTPSLVSLSTVDDSDDDIVPAPVIGRKRNAGSLDDSEFGSQHSDRIVKRLRVSQPPLRGVPDVEDHSIVTINDPLSSPSTLPIHVNQLISRRHDVKLGQEDGYHTAPLSRKRRLSDADAHIVPKRPRGLSTDLRLHAVSDPFPVSSVPTAAQPMDDWFNMHFGPPDATWQSWREIEHLIPVSMDFFNGWAPSLVDNRLSQSTASGTTSHQINVDRNIQPIISPSFDATVASPSVGDCGVLTETPADRSLSDLAAISLTVSSPIEVPILGMGEGLSPQPSCPLLPTLDAFPISALASPTALTPSSPSYQCDLPNTTSEKSSEPDVISLYTTLYETDSTQALPEGDSVSLHIPDISVACPFTFSESVDNEDGWAQFLVTSDQPLEVVLPTPILSYDPPMDITRLLENVLQSVDVAGASTLTCTHQLLDKQQKLTELEAAKEVVRRLEAEVGFTA